MINAILLSRGIPARTVEHMVVIEGRPGCQAIALNGEPRNPVIQCAR